MDCDAYAIYKLSDNTQKEPTKRGYTKMRKIAKMADGKQLDVGVNSYNQFNGQDATTFANYLGTLVRNGEEVPLNYMNWKDVPKVKNNRLWDLVKVLQIQTTSCSFCILLLKPLFHIS